MNPTLRFFQAPGTTLIRRIFFQIHLWFALACALYILVVSLSGTALLLKSPFYSWFEPKFLEPSDAEPLTGSILKERMAEVYEGYTLGFTVEGYEPKEATYIVLQKDNQFIPHYFNQYTGEDIGPARPWQIQAVEWVAGLHYELGLPREQGRRINGALGLVFILMAVTGLVIWWQGKRRWWEGLIIVPGSTRSMLWQLHSFFGFWFLILIFAYGVTGYQLGFPREMASLLETLRMNSGRSGEGFLGFLRDIHFARPGGQNPFARWAWIFATSIPAFMIISGSIIWWRRVIKPRQSNV